MATSDPALPPHANMAPKLLIPVWIMFAIAAALYAVRIRMRIRMVKRFYADDYAITLAMLALAVELPALTVSCRYGLGRHSFYVSPAAVEKATFYLYIAIFPFYTGAAASRVSIGLTLLRLKQDSRIWTRAIWAIIALLVVQGISNTAVQFTQCIPLEALWKAEAREHATCMTIRNSNIWGWMSSVMYILSDIVFSLLPLTFIPSLHLPLRQKFLISLLMSLGMVASTFSVVKIIYRINYAYHSSDKLWDSVDMSLWSKLEEILIAVAACAPTLKGTADRLCTWVILVFQNWRERTRKNKQSDGGNENGTAGLDMVRNGEAFGRTRKVGASETEEEELRPKWWFLPHGFIHTDLITTIDLNRRSDNASQPDSPSDDGASQSYSEESIEFRSITDSNV
jgi:hypothetical protein